MRLHRFYINSEISSNENVLIPGERLLNQWRNVFRYGAGDRVILFDGSGLDFLCEIKKIGKEKADLSILNKTPGVVPEKEIWLFISLIKKDKLEWVAEKATELGVSHVVPVLSERSEKKNFNAERLKKIIIEASEQCGRSNIPVLHEMVIFNEALAFCAKNKIKALAFDSKGSAPKVSNYKLQVLSLFIGPEGGFTEKELFEFASHGVQLFTLGKLTLRTETAAVSILSLATLI